MRMHNRASRLLSVVLLVVVAALGLAACSSTKTTSKVSKPTAKPKKALTIALVNGDNEDPYFYSVWAGALAEAKKYGAKLTEVAPPTFDYATQEPLFADEIAKHPSGIILSADGTGNAYNALLAKAKAAGIPVGIVNETEADMNNNPDSLFFITSSNTGLSRDAGKELVKLLHGKGEVGILNSSVTVISDLHRATGMEAYIKKHAPDIKILPMEITSDSVSTADSDATDLIEAHPHLSAIFAVDDFNAEGAATAIKALHKVGIVKLVAIDAEPAEIKDMKAGIIQALVAQQPFHVGELAVQYIMDAIEGKTSLIQRNVSPPGIILTPQNVNDPQYKDVPYDPHIP